MSSIPRTTLSSVLRTTLSSTLRTTLSCIGVVMLALLFTAKPLTTKQTLTVNYECEIEISKWRPGMSFNTKQFRSYIKRVLKNTDKLAASNGSQVRLYSASAVELLILTAEIESRMGRFLWQLGFDNPKSAPGKGIFQIEETTLNWLIEKVRKDDKYGHIETYLSEIVVDFEDSLNLIRCLDYQILFARLRYYVIPEPIPDHVEGWAEYWKRHYNTYQGKGNPAQAIKRYLFAVKSYDKVGSI